MAGLTLGPGSFSRGRNVSDRRDFRWRPSGRPFCLVAESVRVSVGQACRSLRATYDFRMCVIMSWPPCPTRFRFYYAVFVPKSADSLEDFAAINRAKIASWLP